MNIRRLVVAASAIWWLGLPVVAANDSEFCSTISSVMDASYTAFEGMRTELRSDKGVEIWGSAIKLSGYTDCVIRVPPKPFLPSFQCRLETMDRERFSEAVTAVLEKVAPCLQGEWERIDNTPYIVDYSSAPDLPAFSIYYVGTQLEFSVTGPSADYRKAIKKIFDEAGAEVEEDR